MSGWSLTDLENGMHRFVQYDIIKGLDCLASCIDTHSSYLRDWVITAHLGALHDQVVKLFMWLAVWSVMIALVFLFLHNISEL